MAPSLLGAQLWLYRSVPVLPGDIYLFIYVQRNDDDGDDNNDGDDNKRLAGGLFPSPRVETDRSLRVPAAPSLPIPDGRLSALARHRDRHRDPPAASPGKSAVGSPPFSGEKRYPGSGEPLPGAPQAGGRAPGLSPQHPSSTSGCAGHFCLPITLPHPVRGRSGVSGRRQEEHRQGRTNPCRRGSGAHDFTHGFVFRPGGETRGGSSLKAPPLPSPSPRAPRSPRGDRRPCQDPWTSMGQQDRTPRGSPHGAGTGEPPWLHGEKLSVRGNLRRGSTQPCAQPELGLGRCGVGVPGHTGWRKGAGLPQTELCRWQKMVSKKKKWAQMVSSSGYKIGISHPASAVPTAHKALGASLGTPGGVGHGGPCRQGTR